MASLPNQLSQSASTDSLEPLLSIDEAGALLRRSHWSLRADIKHGRIRCLRLGGRILFEASEIRRVIAAARGQVQ